MKKLSTGKIAVWVFLGIAAACLLLQLWYSGVFVTDYSVAVYAEGGMRWQGRVYQKVGSTSGYTEGRTLAKSENGWKLNEVREDPSHNIVIVRSFLDQYLYVAEGHEIPADG